MGKIYAVTSGKGGVGKSTVSVGLATAFANMGQTVLLVDMDEGLRCLDVMLGIEETDATVADLMIDGCNMGVKSLNKYLNEYEAADEVSKDIAKRLIHLEESLAEDLRPYL